MGVEFLTINVLLHTKSEQKYTNIFFKSVKTRFFNKKYTLRICVGRVWVVKVYFLLEKQTFYGLLILKVIGIQIMFLIIFKVGYIMMVKSKYKISVISNL